ncbi:MAG: STAS domain-containing protein [Spirochaetes bacterium]|nr:STAS domain-containing protein [Spirochaetota bacterium]
MSIAEVEEHHGVTVIRIFGSLTMKIVEEFDELCQGAIRKGPEAIGIDCRDLDFIDSVSINHLFKISHLAVDQGIKMILFDMNPTISHIFSVTGLDKLLRVMQKDAFESEFLIE